MTLDDQTSIPAATLELSVAGQHLAGSSLGDVLRGEPTALVFLRHFG